jgi:cell division protein FtsX
MRISVLERRSEIGLRPGAGATRGQIRIQFLAEAILLSLAGGAAGRVNHPTFSPKAPGRSARAPWAG